MEKSNDAKREDDEENEEFTEGNVEILEEQTEGSLENVIAIQKEKLEKIKALLKGDTRADQSHT